MAYHFNVNLVAPVTCVDCAFLRDCGGRLGEEFHQGCFQRCHAECVETGCDLACPYRPWELAERLEEAGGWAPSMAATLPAIDLTALPSYLPNIYHGSRRQRPLNRPVVAIPLHTIVGYNQRGKYGVRFDSPEALRKALGLRLDAKVLVVSVEKDRVIEEFWAHYQKPGLLPAIANLDILAMTTPNFSFMLDVPYTNSMVNFGRIQRVAEELAGAGIPAILHLNSITERDWSKWATLLQDHPEVSCVAMEFQTGTRKKHVGNRFFFNLLALQRAVGRPLHPVVLAGMGRVPELKENFRSFSVVDATPFMRTTKRWCPVKIPGGRVRWRYIESLPYECLADRLEKAISVWETSRGLGLGHDQFRLEAA